MRHLRLILTRTQTARTLREAARELVSAGGAAGSG